MIGLGSVLPLFGFDDPAAAEIYTLSLHDALPILAPARIGPVPARAARARTSWPARASCPGRSEEHTSELQSHSDLVCRLLPEKKIERRPLQDLAWKPDDFRPLAADTVLADVDILV